ncbi:4533_t:CDS:1, partial [Funneliformis caledonium]
PKFNWLFLFVHGQVPMAKTFDAGLVQQNGITFRIMKKLYSVQCYSPVTSNGPVL